MLPISRWAIWESTLFRYLLGPTVAIILMTFLVLRFAGIDRKNWFEDSTIYQTSPEGPEWQPFSKPKLSSLRDQNQLILVHFVANWSPQSLQNRVALCSSDRLSHLFDDFHVRLLLADANTPGSPAVEALHELGEEAFPLIAIYKPGAQHAVLFRGKLDENAIAAEIVKPPDNP
ncbi:hypothetical protein K2Y11_07080 [bacterium]|nr:hypothetical protein [bacterium]